MNKRMIEQMKKVLDKNLRMEVNFYGEGMAVYDITFFREKTAEETAEEMKEKEMKKVWPWKTAYQLDIDSRVRMIQLVDSTSKVDVPIFFHHSLTIDEMVEFVRMVVTSYEKQWKDVE
ncbi:MAG: hypothetical protein DRQ88_05930 [Epsilonproteobacteria bacterium]|nr:MAG: hypothetical protein DRQ88_05930 [Campylobacterota bacterium]